jgi:hypothetical protein
MKIRKRRNGVKIFEFFIMCSTVECETAEGAETFHGSTGIICYYSTVRF